MTTRSVTVVLTPAESRDLITLEDLREQLEFSANNTAQDEWLQKVITRASLQADRYCKRIFAVQTYQDIWGTYTGEPNAPLILSQAPADVSTITIDGTPLDTTGWVVDGPAGLIYPAGDTMSWTASSNLIVEFEAGFDPIPDDVQMAVLDLCVMEYMNRKRDPMLREEENPNLGRRTYWVGPIPGQTLPAILGPSLDPYVRGGGAVG